MACKSCAERRKKLQALRDAKKLKRQGAQAAAIGAVLAVTEAAGKVLGINGEEDNEGQVSNSDSSTTGAEGKWDIPDSGDESLFGGRDGNRTDHQD